MISRILKINVKALVRANRAKPDFISNGSECEITYVFGGVLFVEYLTVKTSCT